MSDYDDFLDEMARERAERIKHDCKNGFHTWSHAYNFARCSTCGETMPITPPIRNDN